MNFESIAKILKDIQFTFREDSKHQKIFNVMKLIFEIFTFIFLMRKKHTTQYGVSVDRAVDQKILNGWIAQLARCSGLFSPLVAQLQSL